MSARGNARQYRSVIERLWIRPVRLISGTLAVLALVAGGVLTFGEPAFAAGASVSISPSATTVQSNVSVTDTLTVSCSTTGGCTDTVVSFPSTAITGDGPVSDFASWITQGTCPSMTATGGVVSFGYGTIPTGTSQCAFTVRAPEYTTLNGAQATITPTLTSSNSASSTGDPVVLTVTAGHNDSLQKSAPARALTGGSFAFSLSFLCGANADYVGDIGLSALHISDPLPANFTYTGYTLRNGLHGTITPPAVGTSGGTFSYDGDGSDCADPPLNVSNAIVITVQGTASTAGVPDTVGDTVCNSASSTFTYLDGVADSSSAGPACTTVTDIQTTATKSALTSTIGNAGQYVFSGDNRTYPYTYPGDWDASGAPSEFDLAVKTVPATVNAGISYDLSDPLPCLDDVSGGVAASNEPGTACAQPGFVPVLITASGFTPTTGDAITLLYADGTTGTAAYTAGTGWSIPASPVVSEIDIPAFMEEGNNSAATMTFRVKGYASSSVSPDTLLGNTLTSVPYQSGGSSPVSDPVTSTASLLVVDPQSPSGTIVYPGLSSRYSGACVEAVSLNNPSNSSLTDRIEIASAPSQAIYVDYLAPKGATGFAGTSMAFTLKGNNGHTYTSSVVTPTQQADYNGTGRTLLSWAIPSGLAQVPGNYELRGGNAISVSLEAGCAGTYQNDVTVGYGGPITMCYFDNYSSAHVQAAPMAPTADDQLDTNGTPIAGNYCGYSAPLKVTPVNPAFSVDKTVQGNLDATAIGSGGVGDVSPTGGTATYTVTFTNTGQSNLHDPVMYDLLPRVGDTEATSTTPRGSQFAVSLSDVAVLPSGVTVAYSTAANPCRPEVLASDPGCVDDWSTTAPSPIANTTALRIMYSGEIGVSGSSAPNTFSVSYDVTTPSAAQGAKAWNSVGTNVYAGDDMLGAAESSLTGLQTAQSQPQIVKSASTASISGAGDAITYTFEVTNNTAVPLTGVHVTDAFTDAAAGDVPPDATCVSLSNPAAACSGASTSLAPGQVAEFTATYRARQADLDHGVIKDQATVTSQPPTGGALVNLSNEVAVNVAIANSLTLDKTVQPKTVDAAGDAVTYTFTVKNTGNQTLHGLNIDDESFSGTGQLGAISCDDTTLSPSDQTTCHADYAVTQGDIDAGTVTNTARAVVLDPSDGSIISAPSDATVTVEQHPALTLTKSASPATVGEAGDDVTFDFLVENTGNVTLGGVGIDEGAFTGSAALSSIVCPTDRLAPTADMTCTATYTVTQDDVDAGVITNTATAIGTAPGAQPQSVVSPASTASVAVVQSALLTLHTTTDVHTVTGVGQRVVYTFHIVNKGNVTVHGVTVQTKAFTANGTLSAIQCPSGASSLAPGAAVDCTATYTVTGSDLRLPSFDDTAVATGTAASAPVASNSDTVKVEIDAPATPAFGLADTGSALVAPASAAGGIALLGVAIVLMRRRSRNAEE